MRKPAKGPVRSWKKPRNPSPPAQFYAADRVMTVSGTVRPTAWQGRTRHGNAPAASPRLGTTCQGRAHRLHNGGRRAFPRRVPDSPVPGATFTSMTTEDRPRSPGTLGDVLYARSKPPVLEQEWATLVAATASGDQVALHTLYEMAHRPVFTLALRITSNRETAEELTVDVFHDVWRHAARYDAANGTVLGWIMNQARSRAIDRLRFENRKKRRPDGDLDPPAEAAADPRDVLEMREQGRSLRAAMAGLTAGERQAIETTFLSGLTHVEAAARLNQPLGTIKTRIRSGLHKLRDKLAAEAGEP